MRRRSDPRELDEPAVDQLEHAPVDRFVGAAGLLDDEVGEQRREVVVVRAQRGRRQQVPLGQADEDPAERPELRREMRDAPRAAGSAPRPSRCRCRS